LLGAQQQGAMCRSCRQVATHTKVMQGELKVFRSLRPHRIFGVWKKTKQLGLEAHITAIRFERHSITLSVLLLRTL